MSEAYGKAMTADVVVSISRKSYEKASGQGRIFVAKNRAGRDGLVFPCTIDTARSKFTIVGQAETPEEAHTGDEAGIKKRLKDKWNELRSDPNFQSEADKARTE